MEKLPSSISRKKESGVDQIIGVSKEDEEGMLSYFSNLLKSEIPDPSLKDSSAEFQETFSQVNQDLKSFLKNLGVEALDIPAAKIKILDKEKLYPMQREYLEKRGTDALYVSRFQTIVIFEDWEEGKKLRFLQRLVHEMIHMQAFESWQKLPEEKKRERDLILGKNDQKVHLGLRRLGFRITGRDGKSIYFHNIDEAITTELTMRFDWEYFSKYPELSQELKVRNEAIEALAKGNNTSIEEERRHLAEIQPTSSEDGRTKFELKGYSYDKEREHFVKMCEEIYQKNQETFSSPEEVFGVFVKAAMTGQLLPLARIIESTYGKGTFRSLAEETAVLKDRDVIS